ncbi:MAG: SCP2 sterol-binding domain-containing protein [bacterium]
MAQFNVPEDVKVEDFFENQVPAQFPELAAGADLSSLAGKEFLLQFEVDDSRYCLNIKGGKEVEVIKGGVDKPALCISLTESDWRDAVTGKLGEVIDRFTDPSELANENTFNALLSTKGKLNVELKKEDGSVIPLTMTFGGESTPEASIKLSLADWVAMQKGEANGPNLVMTGKMEFTGDMMFLMGLQSLM